MRRIDVETADEMLLAMSEELAEFPYAWVAMVAAVADLKAKNPRSGKLDKAALPQALAADAWVEGVDVLATLTERFGNETRFLGFGAQTVDEGDDVAASLLAAGRGKLQRKGCDAIFVNRVGVPGVGFGSDTNTGVLVRRDVEAVEDAGAPMAKLALAGWILDRLSEDSDVG